MATFGALYQDALDVELGSNDSAVLFTTARRKHAINEGYRQFADLTECLTRQSTVTVSTGAQEYNLLSTTVLSGGDFVRVASQGPVYQTFDSNGSLSQSLAGDNFPQRAIPLMDATGGEDFRSTSAGTPAGWYLRPSGGQLLFGLDRLPDLSSNETAQLIVPYVPNPSSMTASTDVPFTVTSQTRTDLQPYHQALVHYAAHDLEKIRKDPEAAATQLEKFMGYVQRYLGAMRPKGGRGIRTARAYFPPRGESYRETPWWSRS